VELTTYYPAPFGEYRQLKATGADSTSTVALQAGGSTTPAGLTVTNSNAVGIRTTPTYGTLDVNGTIYSNSNITGASISSGGQIQSTSNSNPIYAPNGTIRGRDFSDGNGFYTDGSGNVIARSFTYFSDKKLKENIVPVADPLGKIERLTGVNFTFKDHPGEKHLGLIAQDVEPVVPEVVRTQTDGMKSVDYAALIALLIQGMKEQQQEINALREELGQVKTAVISGR